MSSHALWVLEPSSYLRAAWEEMVVPEGWPDWTGQCLPTGERLCLPVPERGVCLRFLRWPVAPVTNSPAGGSSQPQRAPAIRVCSPSTAVGGRSWRFRDGLKRTVKAAMRDESFGHAQWLSDSIHEELSHLFCVCDLESASYTGAQCGVQVRAQASHSAPPWHSNSWFTEDLETSIG